MINKNNHDNLMRIFTWSLIAVALIGGVCSYLAAGYGLDDAFFGAFQLFQFEGDSTSLNMGLRIFRWLAPLSIATTLFIEIAPLFMWLRDRMVFLFSKDRIIIYSDCYAGEALYYDPAMKGKAVLHKEAALFSLSDNANSSVILMDNDEDALKLFRHMNKDNWLYLCLNSMEPSLLPSSGKTVICNINDITAGYFWHKEFMGLKDRAKKDPSSWRDPEGRHFFEEKPDREIEMIIWGYDRLGKRLLYKGLIFNIFTPSQKIIYHIYDPDHNGDSNLEDIKKAASLNGDEVNFHYDEREINEIANSVNAIIIPSNQDPDKIQERLYSTSKPDLYYYDPSGVRLETTFSSGNSTVKRLYSRLHGFGADSDIIKAKYIMHSGLIKKAKSISECLHKNKTWEKLSGFDKGDIVNATDYMDTGAMISSWKCFSDDELIELEHVRRCRYAYLNHWRIIDDSCEPFNEEKETDQKMVETWTSQDWK